MDALGETIVYRAVNEISPWVSVVEKGLRIGGRIEAYHCLRQADYVCVLAFGLDGRIPIVRQYRPAVEAVTLELPSGLFSQNEIGGHNGCAVRELAEEVGFHPVAPLEMLGQLMPDTGRLENNFFSYFCRQAVSIPNWTPETGVERLLVTKAELADLVRGGEFSHALHLAVLTLAILRGHLPELSGA